MLHFALHNARTIRPVHQPTPSRPRRHTQTMCHDITMNPLNSLTQTRLRPPLSSRASLIVHPLRLPQSLLHAHSFKTRLRDAQPPARKTQRSSTLNRRNTPTHFTMRQNSFPRYQISTMRIQFVLATHCIRMTQTYNHLNKILAQKPGNPKTMVIG